MIYASPAPDDPIDQGDIIRECPIALVETFPPDKQAGVVIPVAYNWVYVLTQACDLASGRLSL